MKTLLITGMLFIASISYGQLPNTLDPNATTNYKTATVTVNMTSGSIKVGIHCTDYIGLDAIQYGTGSDGKN